MKKIVSYLVIFCLTIFNGCEWEVPGTDPVKDYGKLSIHLTDAPFPFDIVDEANITISGIELRDDSDSLGETYIQVFDSTFTANLLELRNGVVSTIVETDVQPGLYSHIRIYVEQASILLSDNRTFEINVPSGEQTGIKVKIDPAVEVFSDAESRILLDFDLSRSFILNGNTKESSKIKGFIFKPVVRAVNFNTSATIAGVVTDTDKNYLENVEVWIESDTVLAKAYTDSKGIYGITGVPEGIYTMLATGIGFDTTRHDLVQIEEGDRIIKNFVLREL